MLSMSMTRSIHGLLAGLALCVSAAACGSGAGRSSSHSRSRPAASSSPSSLGSSPGADGKLGARGPGGYLKYDGDVDVDDHSQAPSKDDEQEMVVASRHPASAVDAQTIAAVVKRYYAAATAEDGVRGCALLSTALARSVAEQQPVDERRPGHAGQGPRTCPPALSRLFNRQHRYLLGEDAKTMVVTGVHVSGAVGFVTLGFRTAPESELLLQRELGTWKLNALFDSPLP